MISIQITLSDGQVQGILEASDSPVTVDFLKANPEALADLISAVDNASSDGIYMDENAYDEFNAKWDSIAS